MKSFVLTPSAQQDLEAIWIAVAERNMEAAERVLTALEQAVFKLAKAPGIGHWREDLADNRHRFFLV